MLLMDLKNRAFDTVVLYPFILVKASIKIGKILVY